MKIKKVLFLSIIATVIVILAVTFGQIYTNRNIVFFKADFNPQFKAFKVPSEIISNEKILIVPENTLSEKEKAYVLNAKNVTDIFPIERIVSLQLTDRSIIGNISDVVFINNRFFVLDNMQKQVYMFNRKGKFLGLVGKKGTGPGEYQWPYRIEEAYNGNVAIACGMTGKIHVYDKHGKYINYFNPAVNKKKFIKGWNFLWPEKNRLYISDFTLFSKTAPGNILVDPEKGDILACFGERNFKLDYELLLNWRAYTFSLVDDYIWSSSTYTTDIGIFNKFGHRIKTLSNPAKDRLTTDELLKLKNRKSQKASIYFAKKRNNEIVDTKKMVLVSVSPWAKDVYDKYGNLLKKDLKMENGISFTLFSNDEKIFLPCPAPGIKAKNFKKYKKLFISAGYDEKLGMDNNPFIFILKPRF